MAPLISLVLSLMGVSQLFEEVVSFEHTVYKNIQGLESYSGGCCGSQTVKCPEVNDKNYYRYLEPSISDPDMLYVGAMNYLLMMNTTTLSCKQYQYIPPDNVTQDRCTRQGKMDVPECQNHIREAFEITNNGVAQLEVCGTRAYKPMMYYFNANLTLNRTGDIKLQSTCPYDPMDNNTLLYSKSGNPGNSSAMYFGFFTDFIKNFPVLMRPRYTYNGQTYVEKTTDSEDVGWLNSPQFAGSFDVDNFVMIFFREKAVEYTESTEKIFSRVGKVCKNDLGGGTPDLAKKEWLSFQKSRLICSLPGSQPYYFDDIYDVAFDEENFYAVFYKQGGDLSASAICVYSKSDILTSFGGPFMFNNGSRVDPSPDPRLDDCHQHDINPSQFVGRTSHNQLMYNPVQPTLGKPIFYKHGVQLLRLALGPKFDNFRNIYVGSSDGEIYDIFVNGSQGTTVLNSVRLPFGPVNPEHSIWQLMLKDNYLIAATDYSIAKVPLDTCSDIPQASRLDECLYNTRCSINTCTKKCELSSTCSNCTCRFVSEAESSDSLRQNIKEWINFQVPTDPPEEITALENIHKSLPIVYPLRLNSVRWMKDGQPLNLEDSNRIAYSKDELILKSIQFDQAGVYTAVSEDGTVVAKYKLKVVLPGLDDTIVAWKESFEMWSTEFNKWKACTKSYTDTCQSVSP